MIAPLLIGVVLAACGLAFVVIPLVVGPTPASRFAAPGDAGSQGGARSGNGASGEVTAVEVLREIEFDRATGKLSEADYGSLKSAYTARALAELRAPETPADRVTPAADSTGSLSSTPSACPACRHRTVADATYCVNCGQYLSARCPDCGAAITMAAARYCGACGGALGAVAT